MSNELPLHRAASHVLGGRAPPGGRGRASALDQRGAPGVGGRAALLPRRHGRGGGDRRHVVGLHIAEPGMSDGCELIILSSTSMHIVVVKLDT